MAFCRSCGGQIADEAVICVHCGVQQNTSPAVNDSGSFGWTVLGCCVPVAGLILWLLWKDSQPRNAKKAGLGALISVIALVLFFVLYFVLIFGLIFAFSA